jgi:hypothetical protein
VLLLILVVNQDQTLLLAAASSSAAHIHKSVPDQEGWQALNLSRL